MSLGLLCSSVMPSRPSLARSTTCSRSSLASRTTICPPPSTSSSRSRLRLVPFAFPHHGMCSQLSFYCQAEIFAGLLDAKLSDFEFPDDFVLDVRVSPVTLLSPHSQHACCCRCLSLCTRSKVGGMTLPVYSLVARPVFFVVCGQVRNEHTHIHTDARVLLSARVTWKPSAALCGGQM